MLFNNFFWFLENGGFSKLILPCFWVFLLWSLSNQSEIWKIIISLHRTFLILANPFLGYWGALFLNVLTITAAARNLTLLVIHQIHQSVCHIALSAVWLCVAQRYVYSRHIIKYVKYYQIYIKKKKSMTFFYQKECSCWSYYSKLWLANVLITPTVVPILLVSVLFGRIFTCRWKRTKWK